MSLTPLEQQQVDELRSSQKKQLEALFAFYESLERHRNELKADVAVLESAIAAAKAAPVGQPLPPSPIVRLGDVEMTLDDAVDWVAECMEFSNKYSSMK